MKNLFILTLVFTISCQGGGSSSSSESSNPQLNSDQSPVNPLPSTPTVPSTPNLTWTDEFILLVNNHRGSLGLRSLIHDEQLGLIAQKHGQNMANGTVAFGHD